MIGCRIRVRVVCEVGDTGMLTVAISSDSFRVRCRCRCRRTGWFASRQPPLGHPPDRLSVAFDLAGRSYSRTK
jgi:hypothetical protein